MDLLLLCWEFFETGLFAIGGGMATIPFLARMSEAHPNWFTLEDLANMIAVGESTPGPIGVNMATYVGYTTHGVLGGIMATVSLVLPSLIILLIIARALDKYRTNQFVNAGFRALRPAVTGLIGAAGYSVLTMALLSAGVLQWKNVLLFVVLFVCTQLKPLKKVHPIAYIGLAAVAGIVFQFS